MMRATLFVTIATLVCSCATSGSGRNGAQISTALRFECDPRDATLIVDEQNQGQCVLWERRSLGLSPGAHRVRVEREGYLPHEAEISGNSPRGTIRISLRERPE